MFTFAGPDDLIRSIEMMKERADRAAADPSNLKREQAHNRARSAAFAEVLELLRDHFSARKEGK